MKAAVYELAVNFTSFGKISEFFVYGTAKGNCRLVEFRLTKDAQCEMRPIAPCISVMYFYAFIIQSWTVCDGT